MRYVRKYKNKVVPVTQTIYSYYYSLPVTLIAERGAGVVNIYIFADSSPVAFKYYSEFVKYLGSCPVKNGNVS